jgi:arylformamidase
MSDGRVRLVELSHTITAGMTTHPGMPLSTLVELPAVVVRVSDGARAVDAAAFDGLDAAGRAVLLHTGWDRHWGTAAYGRDAPYLSGGGARWLVDHDVRLVGIDSVTIGDKRRPAHSLLLRAGIPVVEHLTGLGDLPATGARFIAAPPRVRAFDVFPVRAYAAVPAGA